MKTFFTIIAAMALAFLLVFCAAAEAYTNRFIGTCAGVIALQWLISLARWCRRTITKDVPRVTVTESLELIGSNELGIELANRNDVLILWYGRCQEKAGHLQIDGRFISKGTEYHKHVALLKICERIVPDVF